MKPKILIEGYCWKSQQNGAVYNVGGYPLALLVDSTLELNRR